jgi:hypothetical protein
MYKKRKSGIGKMSGDRLVNASKVADKKIQVAVKPLKLSKLKVRLR